MRTFLNKFSIFSVGNRYIPALFLITVFITLSYKISNEITTSMKNDGELINESGRQRMLCLKLVIDSKNYLDDESTKNELLTTISMIEKGHTYLLTKSNSEKLNNIYINQKLNEDMNSYIQRFKALIYSKNSNELILLRNESTRIIKKLDSIVKIHQEENVKKLEILTEKETTLFYFTLLFLLLEGVFIFYPASRKIYKNEKKLKDEVDAQVKELDNAFSFISKHIIYSQTDLEGIITDASDAFCKISGYSKEELIGKPHNIVRHPDMPAEAFKTMWETIEQGTTWQGEVKNLKKDGGFYWVNATISPIVENNYIVGYRSVRENITEHKKVYELHNNVNTLLNNMNDGLISFKKDFKIISGFSLQSKHLLNNYDLLDVHIADILFKEDLKNKELFEYGIETLFNLDDESGKEMILSLLPKQTTLNRKELEIQCKLIDNEKVLLILKDVTAQKELEEKLLYEYKIQKMIITIAINKEEFIQIKDDFDNFLKRYKEIDKDKTLSENIKQLSQTLHTFKGLFAQKNLVNISVAIHELESDIYYLNNNQPTFHHFSHILIDSNLENAFQKDLHFIEDVFGKDFLYFTYEVKFEQEIFNDIVNKIKLIFEKNEITLNEFKEIGVQIVQMNQKKLKNYFEPYINDIKIIAATLDKQIHPLVLEGDKTILVSGKSSQFLYSLIHVFRNMVDHGIEKKEERLNLGKDPIGTIKCSYHYNEKGNGVKIILEDDGAGINIDKIKQISLKNQLYSVEELESMDKEQILAIIFSPSFSTKDELSLVSGRGIGLNVVKDELDKIGGKIKIETKKNCFTRFHFEFLFE